MLGWYVLGYSPSSWSSVAELPVEGTGARAWRRVREWRFCGIVRNAPDGENHPKPLILRGNIAFCGSMRISALLLDTRRGILTFVKMIDPDARRAALSLIRKGMLTVPEAAELAGVSRHVVHYWCRAAGVETGKARAAVLAKAWRKAVGSKRGGLTNGQ